MKNQRFIKILPAVLFFFFLGMSNLSAQGHFELSVHYSTWNINLLGSIIEDAISDALEGDLKDSILEEVQDKVDPTLQEVSYTQEVDFDSSGNNYGFEIRWYPGGQYGSFSIGFSVEKTSMTLELPTVSANMGLTNDANFQGGGDGSIEINPLSFHLSFRWDLLPTSRVTPYITLGGGMASFSSIENDKLTYSWSGDATVAGVVEESLEGGETKTLKELRDEAEAEDEDFLPIGFLPFIQLNLGLKGKITDFVHIMVDAGIWNGFLIRGGIALRL
jgi:hypothetical protein